VCFVRTKGALSSYYEKGDEVLESAGRAARAALGDAARGAERAAEGARRRGEALLSEIVRDPRGAAAQAVPPPYVHAE